MDMTLSEISKVSGIPVKRLAYAQATYSIEPTRRAGLVKLFDEAAVQHILQASRRVADRAVKHD